jgi:hypothetical protein
VRLKGTLAAVQQRHSLHGQHVWQSGCSVLNVGSLVSPPGTYIFTTTFLAFIHFTVGRSAATERKGSFSSDSVDREPYYIREAWMRVRCVMVTKKACVCQ